MGPEWGCRSWIARDCGMKDAVTGTAGGTKGDKEQKEAGSSSWVTALPRHGWGAGTALQWGRAERAG